MLREDKIRRMTDIAMFKKKHSRAIMDAGLYFKGDYTARFCIRGFFGFTLAFLLIVIVCVLCRLDYYLGDITMESFFLRLRELLCVYLVSLAIYLGIVVTVAFRSYDEAEGYRRVFFAKMRYLARRYDFQNRKEQLLREEKQV